MMIPHPPAIHGYQVNHGTRLRFQVASGGYDTTISVDQLLNTILFAKTTTTLSTLFTFVKVRAVEVWALSVAASGAALETPSTIRVVYAEEDGVTQGDAVVHTDTSMGIEPAYVRAVPNRRSLISNYQAAGAGTAFTLQAPQGAVVDVDLSFKQQFNVNNNALAVAVAVTAGAIYLRGLDGVALAATLLPSVLVDYAC
jgi:hypothetical protein